MSLKSRLAMFEAHCRPESKPLLVGTSKGDTKRNIDGDGIKTVPNTRPVTKSNSAQTDAKIGGLSLSPTIQHSPLVKPKSCFEPDTNSQKLEKLVDSPISKRVEGENPAAPVSSVYGRATSNNYGSVLVRKAEFLAKGKASVTVDLEKSDVKQNHSQAIQAATNQPSEIHHNTTANLERQGATRNPAGQGTDSHSPSESTEFNSPDGRLLSKNESQDKADHTEATAASAPKTAETYPQESVSVTAKAGSNALLNRISMFEASKKRSTVRQPAVETVNVTSSSKPEMGDDSVPNLINSSSVTESSSSTAIHVSNSPTKVASKWKIQEFQPLGKKKNLPTAANFCRTGAYTGKSWQDRRAENVKSEDLPVGTENKNDSKEHDSKNPVCRSYFNPGRADTCTEKPLCEHQVDKADEPETQQFASEPLEVDRDQDADDDNAEATRRRISSMRPGVFRGLSFDDTDDEDAPGNDSRVLEIQTNDGKRDEKQGKMLLQALVVESKKEDSANLSDEESSTSGGRCMQAQRPGSRRSPFIKKEATRVNQARQQFEKEKQDNSGHDSDSENGALRYIDVVRPSISSMRPGMMRGTSFDEPEERGATCPPISSMRPGMTRGTSFEEPEERGATCLPISSMRPGMTRGTSFDEPEERGATFPPISSMRPGMTRGTSFEEPEERGATFPPISSMRPGMTRGTSFDEPEERGATCPPISSMRPGMTRGMSFDDPAEDNQRGAPCVPISSLQSTRAGIYGKSMDNNDDDSSEDGRGNGANIKVYPPRRINSMRPGMFRGTSFD